jgi:hypothetical protein
MPLENPLAGFGLLPFGGLCHGVSLQLGGEVGKEQRKGRKMGRM